MTTLAARDDMTDLAHIIEPLREHAVPVGDLHLDPANANTHPERNIRAIMESMREFGQRQVIVARESTKTIIAGNGRLEAARKLGWSHVATVYVDDDDITALRYAIADNRSSELSEWDGEVLSQVLQTVEDDFGSLDGTGFGSEELDDLLENLSEPDAGEWGDAFGGIPDEEHEPETSWRFLLHQDQKEDIEQAIGKAKRELDCTYDQNENTNGNALWAMAVRYLHG